MKTINNRLTERKLIEALRLGIVPDNDLINFTFQRENETSKIKLGYEEVEQKGGCVKVIFSSYGTGKTHFLNYIQKIAIEDGWLVARVDSDTKERSFYRPRDIYNEIVNTIKGQISSIEINKIEDLLLIIGENSYLAKKYKNAYVIGRVIKTLQDDLSESQLEALWKWFKGEQIPIGEVRKNVGDKTLGSFQRYSTNANKICNIINVLGCIAMDLGFKGLFIAFDEVENIELLPKAEKDKAINFIKGLFLITLGENSPEIRYDEKELIHSKARGKMDSNIPYYHDFPASLYLLFAMTPKSGSSVFDDNLDSKRFFQIESLKVESFLKLGLKLMENYEKAYGFELKISEDELRTYILNNIKGFGGLYLSNIRLITKFLIETFDLIRHKKALNLNSFQ